VDKSAMPVHVVGGAEDSGIDDPISMISDRNRDGAVGHSPRLLLSHPTGAAPDEPTSCPRRASPLGDETGPTAARLGQGRRFWGAEIDGQACAIARSRVAEEARPGGMAESPTAKVAKSR
jgi:hypothetical protein